MFDKISKRKNSLCQAQDWILNSMPAEVQGLSLSQVYISKMTRAQDGEEKKIQSSVTVNTITFA